MFEEEEVGKFGSKKSSFMKPQVFKVLKSFTAEKFYKKGSSITLTDKKLIEKLIIEKFIK